MVVDMIRMVGNVLVLVLIEGEPLSGSYVALPSRRVLGCDFRVGRSQLWKGKFSTYWAPRLFPLLFPRIDY